MTITLKYFGLLADITNKKEETLLLEDETVALSFLKNKMENQYEALQNTTYAIAINQSLTVIDATIKDQDVIAFLPPFAGG
jgi:molybdopterin synthase sulfur carrier subunit